MKSSCSFAGAIDGPGNYFNTIRVIIVQINKLSLTFFDVSKALFHHHCFN
jgi:hypothetical protein